VNVALPAIQTDLGFSADGLQWVVNAYTLGGLLLPGGRMSDLLGRRRRRRSPRRRSARPARALPRARPERLGESP
jgi:MFS family permease